MMPFAPGRLSITICCPTRSVSRLPMKRASRSVPLPAGNGTIARTGREGQDAASAATADGEVTATMASNAATAHSRSLRAAADMRLFSPDSGVPDHRGDPRQLGFHGGGKLLGRASDSVHAE